MMLDKEFTLSNEMRKFVAAAQEFFEHIDGQYILVVDLDLMLTFISTVFAKSLVNAEGYSFKQILDGTPYRIDLQRLTAVLEKTMQDRVKRQVCLPLYINKRMRLINLFIGAVIYNGKVIGATVYMVRFNTFSRIEMVLQALKSNAKFDIENIAPIYLPQHLSSIELGIKLTHREETVVFLLILNFTSREIAGIISSLEGKSVSKDAIDKLIANQLQLKFNVTYRYQLVERLVNLGYHKLMPDLFTERFVKESLLLD